LHEETKEKNTERRIEAGTPKCKIEFTGARKGGLGRKGSAIRQEKVGKKDRGLTKALIRESGGGYQGDTKMKVESRPGN